MALQPKAMTTDELADLLTALAEAVRSGDSLEGSLEWLLPGPDEKHDGDTMHGGCPHVMVTAAFRVGNRAGQGGMQFIGEHQDEPAPPDPTPAGTRVEYGVRAEGILAQLYGDLPGALCCAARYHYKHKMRPAEIVQRDVTEWRPLTLPEGTEIPRVVTCRHNPEPHPLNDDEVDFGPCVDVVDVDLKPVLAGLEPADASCSCCSRKVRPLDGDGRCVFCGPNRERSHHDGQPCPASRTP